MLFFVVIEERLLSDKPQQEAPKNLEPRWLEITSERKRVKVDLNKLCFVESKNEQIILHFEDKQLVSRERIGQISQRLPEDFRRIHRSFVVNSARLTSI